MGDAWDVSKHGEMVFCTILYSWRRPTSYGISYFLPLDINVRVVPCQIHPYTFFRIKQLMKRRFLEIAVLLDATRNNPLEHQVSTFTAVHKSDGFKFQNMVVDVH